MVTAIKEKPASKRIIYSEQDSIYKKDWILYTTSDEDSYSELKALRIRPSDSVLVITGSGCRSLALLVDEPKRLISVDANPTQNYLLELKIEAMRLLRHDEYLQFLGVKPATFSRLDVYREFESNLTPQAQAYWSRYRDKIEEGLIYLGKHEQFYKKYIGSLLFRPKKKQFLHMLSLTSLEEQRAYFHEHFNTPLWRWSIENLCRQTVFKWALGDPSYDNQVNQQQSIGNYILQRLTHTFENHLVRDNHFLTFLYCGEYMNDEALPVYLQKRHYETIKKNLDKVEIVTDLIDQYLAREKEPFIDKVSLSDISGWIPNETFQKILVEITKKMEKNGIICYRNFLAKRSVDPGLLARYDRDVEMIERLNHEDLAFAFTFEVLKKRGE